MRTLKPEGDDITDQPTAGETDRENDGSHFAEAILRTMRQPLLVLSDDLRVEVANRAFLQTFSVEEGEITGRPVFELGNGEWDFPGLRELLEVILPNKCTVEDFKVEHGFEQIGRRVMLLNARRMRRADRPDTILLEIDDITEQDQARALLEGEKEYYEKIVDSSRDALLILDFDLRVKSANETFYNTFRIDQSAAEGRTVYELGDGQWDIPELRHLLENVLPNDDAFDNYMVEKDFIDLGHRIMVLNARRVDHMQLILLAIEDQTAARRADRALRESELLRRVIDNLFSFVGLLTPEGIVIETNRAPLQAAAIELADVQGRPFEDCYWWSYSSEVQAQLREAISRAAQGEMVRYDTDARIAGGRLMAIDFMLAPLRDEVGKIIGLVPSAVDISERKRLTEARFQAFLDVAPDALILVRSDGTIHSVNDQAERLFGYSRAELIGRPHELLMPERYRESHTDHQTRFFENPHRRPMGSDLEIYGRTKDGREIPLEVSLSPMTVPEGRLALAAARDITERRQAEQTLRAAKQTADTANALKSRFVAAASHDLRQPLQTIGLLGGVLAQTAKEEASRAPLAQLRDTVAAMGDIIDSLLDIDRLDSGQIEPEIVAFPIQRLLDRMQSQFSYLAEAGGLQLRIVASSSILLSDQRLLERLVGNLVSNAIRYTEADGRVLIGCRRRGGSMRIEVRDTGVGIPEAQLEAVFEEYYRLAPSGDRQRDPGLGLGLALVKRLAEVLEHPMEVRSTPGKGSMFAVELPMVRAGRAASRDGSEAARPGVPVLLVEDEAGPRESLRLLLELNGYAVRAAATAGDALDLEFYEVPPRLVIADYRLGTGMTGLQLIQHLRDATALQFPAIVLTGDTLPATRREIESAGCRHVAKPVRPDDLLELAGQLTGQEPDAAATAAAHEAPAPVRVQEQVTRDAATVFVVEDDPQIQSAIRSLVEAAGHRVEAFASAESFLQALGADAGQGCVVLDVGLPGMSGLQVQERLKADGFDLPVVVITGRHEMSLAVRAMRAGAVDFLEKPFDADRLLESVNRALTHAAPSQATAPQPEFGDVAARFARLTPREREVIGLVAEGHPNKEVAHRLGLSQRTVENYRARGMQKLGIRSLADLVRLAVAAEASGFAILSQ